LKPAPFIPDAALKCPTNDGNFKLIPFFMNKAGPDFTIIPNNVDRVGDNSNPGAYFSDCCIYFPIWIAVLYGLY
jgi:hypothetical protein